VADFLKFINKRYGPESTGRLSVLDLKMEDVEAYNAELVDGGFSDQLVTKRLLAVKAIIDRAGRPEHGEQVLTWNWNARDKLRGKAGTPRILPTLPQLKHILAKCDARTRAIVWMGIGLGFGQGDLSAVRMGQIDAKNYDLRRGKTGLERYGETPPGVWKVISEYLKENPRKLGDLLFETSNGQPVSHGNTDAVHLWWRRLRISMEDLGKDLGGFYVLRHLGATEFGSRPGCSIGSMRRWLGHAASSSVADVYMRPVSPEHRKVVEWVRKQLKSKK
jgi:integrase